MKKNRSSRRSRKYLQGNYWMREDMGVLGFAWTLLLLGTVAAAETDQPVFWLLVGPVPFLIGFVVVVALRQRFKSFSCQSSVVRKEHEGQISMAVPPEPSSFVLDLCG
jgi:peptidoglycan/LPS O-acetylase OafA/YrhL